MAVIATNELAEFIRSGKTTREYERGDIICAQDDDFNQVFLLESGFVKTYDIDEEGNERTINIFGAGSAFPVTWLLASAPRYHYFYYEAVGPVTCMVADVHDTRDFINSHPKSLQLLTDHLVRANINLASRILNLEKSKVSERLEFVLLNLAKRLGEINGGVARLDAVITQEEIAKLAGVTRESLSFEINHRVDQRPYWRDGRHTYIDMGNIHAESKPVVLSDE